LLFDKPDFFLQSYITVSAKFDYWNLVLSSLESKVQGSHYKAWFSQLGFVRVADHGQKIVLNTFSKFAQKYIESKYHNELLTSIKDYYPRVEKIDFEILEKPSKTSKKPEDIENQISFDNGNNLGDSLPKIKLVESNSPRKNLNNLNPKYSFENFVVTSSNELVTTIAKVICKDPGTQYNPIFIYSGVGLGKTHLLNAIGQKTLELHPSFNIKYITAESFTTQYIEAVRGRQMRDFNDFYRNVDLLMIDDIQFIAGKEGTQEAFFHIFNILKQNNKQIVITSDKHPKSLGGMEERLISRFEWGIVVDISKPNFDDRKVVLKVKAANLGLPLNETQINLIAEKINTNYRDMEGVLNRIQARIQLLPNKPFEDIELSQLLGGFEYTSLVSIDISKVNYSSDEIIGAVGNYFNLKKEMILAKNREKEVVNARRIIMHIMKNDLGYTLSSIGKIFDKNHSTISHAIDSMESELKSQTPNARHLENIRSKIMR
jgi:chromosomal replication initiator protein